MKIHIELRPAQAEALLEAELAMMPIAAQERIRGHGSRSREIIRTKILRLIDKEIRR
jgi:hypothetical protein